MKTKHVAAALAIAIGCVSTGAALADTATLSTQSFGSNSEPKESPVFEESLSKPEAKVKPVKSASVASAEKKKAAPPLTEINLGPQTANGKKISSLLNQKRVEELELEVDKLKQERKKIQDEVLSSSLKEEHEAAIKQLKEAQEKEIAQIHAQYKGKISSINKTLNQIKAQLAVEESTGSINVTDITMFNGSYEATLVVNGETYRKSSGDTIGETTIITINKDMVVVGLKDGSKKELMPVSAHRIPKHKNDNSYLIALIGNLKAEIPSLNDLLDNRSCQAINQNAPTRTARPFGGQATPFTQ